MAELDEEAVRLARMHPRDVGTRAVHLRALRDARVLVDAVAGPQLADVVLDAVVSSGTISPKTDGRLTPTP